MKRLYFIRHGLSEMNKQGVYSGHTDTPLVPEGRKQAKLAGKSAKELTIDLIVSSPLSRALETAQIVANEIGYPEKEILINPLLIERSHGELEGKKALPISERGNVETVKGYETEEMLTMRAQRILKWLESLEADNILVVSHGAIGRHLRKVVLTYEHDYLEGIPNAQIVCWIEDHE